MNFEAFFALLARHPFKTLAGVIAIFGAATTFSGWMIHAEGCHQRGDVAYETALNLAELREHEILQRQAEKAIVAQMCASGELNRADSPVTCAKASAAVEAAAQAR